MVNNYKKSKIIPFKEYKNAKNGGMFRTASQQIRKAMNHNKTLCKRSLALGQKYCRK